jgi:putative acyl-CoA dehydrogenase
MKGKIAEEHARRLVERMAVMLQASLLLEHAPSAVSAAFCASRLGDHGMAFGTLPAGVDFTAIIERSTPDGVSR